jgi:predicted dehydrogenase
VREAVHHEPPARPKNWWRWRAKKLFLMEAMWTRFMPALAEVRRVVASGEIGKVHPGDRRPRLQGRLRA